MRDVRAANAMLWVLNALLGGGIVFFAWQYLLFPSDQGILSDFQPEALDGRSAAPPPRDPGDGALRLGNPVVPGATKGPEAAVATFFKATLLGTLRAGEGAAFIKSQAQNTEMVAFVNEEILYEGKPFPEFTGWKLVEVGKSTAVFSDGKRREVLTMSQETAPGRPAARTGSGPSAGTLAGKAYVANEYQSRLLAQSPNRHVWGMDPAELEYARANVQSMLDQDVQAAAHPGGGLKVLSVRPGSMGAARGLIQGDVVRNVNGQALSSLADMKLLMNNPRVRNRSTLTLTVERAGKPFIIEYRPLPRARGR